MRIAYVLAEDLNRTAGGIVHFLAVAGALKRLGHDVIIVGPQYHKTIRRPPGLKHVFIPLPGRSVLGYVAYQFLVAAVFPIIMLLHRPQGLLLRGGGWVLPLVARLFKVTIVQEINGIAYAEMESRGFPSWVSMILRWLTVFQCKTAHRIISVTPAIGRELVRVSGVAEEKIVPIQNGADPEEFDPSCREGFRASLGIAPSTFVVGFVGQFCPWHGTVDLVNSVNHLPQGIRSNILYVLVGSGGQWNEVRRMVQAQRLERVVRLPGAASRAQMVQYLAAFDVGVLVNNDPNIGRFGFSSLKFWEYVAAGLPVIVSDDCNMTPIVEGNRMGIVIKDLTAKGIADAVVEAYRRREEMARIGQQNRELMFEKFSWTYVAKRVVRVLNLDDPDTGE